MKKRILALAATLALVGVLVVPMTVFAANPDTGATTVTGTAATTTWAITVPSATALTISNPRVATSSTAFTVSAATNDISVTTVTINAIGTDGTAPGQLGRGTRAGTSGNEVIAPALTGTSSLLGWTPSSTLATNVVGTAKTLTAEGTYEATDVVITQPIIITPAPVPAAAYTAVITFTATFAP